MRQLKSCLSIFLSFFIIATSTTSFSQEKDPLDQLLQDTNRFLHYRVMVTNNPKCQWATYDSLQDTQLGHLISRFFEVYLLINSRDYLFNRYLRERVVSKLTDVNQNSENLIRLLVWMEQERRDTTPEDINNMRQQLEELKAQFDACLIDSSR